MTIFLAGKQQSVFPRPIIENLRVVGDEDELAFAALDRFLGS
jgi:hypothetical protein